MTWAYNPWRCAGRHKATPGKLWAKFLGDNPRHGYTFDTQHKSRHHEIYEKWRLVKRFLRIRLQLNFAARNERQFWKNALEGGLVTTTLVQSVSSSRGDYTDGNITKWDAVWVRDDDGRFYCGHVTCIVRVTGLQYLTAHVGDGRAGRDDMVVVTVQLWEDRRPRHATYRGHLHWYQREDIIMTQTADEAIFDCDDIVQRLHFAHACTLPPVDIWKELWQREISGMDESERVQPTTFPTHRDVFERKSSEEEDPHEEWQRIVGRLPSLHRTLKQWRIHKLKKATPEDRHDWTAAQEHEYQENQTDTTEPVGEEWLPEEPRVNRRTHARRGSRRRRRVGSSRADDDR